ncbi:MAG: cytochrome c3 family protein [Candidatus Glassbacteria bacterium]
MSFPTCKNKVAAAFLIAFLLPGFPVGGSGLAARPGNDECRRCHGLQAEQDQALKVDFAQAAESAHGKINCTDCHTDIEEIPHAHQLKPVDCLVCHGETTDVSGKKIGLYWDSVHGLASADTTKQDAAACVDCHGKHNIRGHEDRQSLVYRSNIPLTCARCHENNQVVMRHDIRFERPYQEYEQSIHGKALRKDGLLQVAAVCTDCHGAHDIQSHAAARPTASQPQTCGKCHIGIYETYHSSIHGRLHIDESNLDSPGCTDCHGEHGIQSPTQKEAPTSQANIPKTCSSCHADEVRMAKYDIDADRLTTYKQSFHGVAQGLGDQNAANCASCHGYHDIYPPSDPRSRVHPDNMIKTCSECHPKATTNFVMGKIHIDPTKKSAGGIYYLRQTLIWLVCATLAFLAFWVGIDLTRRFRARNRDRSSGN